MNLFSGLLYYLVMIPISALPFAAIRGLSAVLYFSLFYISGYRKKVVLQNLQNSFPEISASEIDQICKKFYKHFADVLLESFKTFTISEKRLKKHLVCVNPEVVNAYYDQKQSIIIAVGHYNSWEFFLTGINTLIKHQAVVIYQPLTNRYFDRKICETRSEFGTKMVSTNEVKNFFENNTSDCSATIFAIDQSPSQPEKCYWMKFLNQDTGVLYGTEKYAKDYNYPVVFARISKVKRGYYELEFVDVSKKPQQTLYGEITETVTRLLEKDILAIPQYWLWSHRRWKHKKPAKK